MNNLNTGKKNKFVKIPRLILLDTIYTYIHTYKHIAFKDEMSPLHMYTLCLHLAFLSTMNIHFHPQQSPLGSDLGDGLVPPVDDLDAGRARDGDFSLKQNLSIYFYIYPIYQYIYIIYIFYCLFIYFYLYIYFISLF